MPHDIADMPPGIGAARPLVQLKRSFLEALAAGMPAAHTDAKSVCSPALMPVPTLQRDASISSTPSLHSECSSPMSMSSASSHSSRASDHNASGDWWLIHDERCEWPSSPLACPAPTMPLIDLCSQAGDIEGEAEGAEEIDTYEEEDTVDVELQAYFDPALDYECNARVRHRSLLQQNEPNHLPDRNWYPTRHSARDVSFFAPSRKSGAGLGRLRLAATGAHRTHARRYGTPASTALTSSGPAKVPNPYDSYNNTKSTEQQRSISDRISSRRSNGKKNSEHKRVRAATHSQRHSLAAATRPAIASASRSFRLVLAARAQRKVELTRAAAGPHRTPKHLRTCSVRRTLLDSTPPAVFHLSSRPTPRADVTVRNARTFDEFRHKFFVKNRVCLERALDHSGMRVTAIRMAPINSAVRQRFMGRLGSLHAAESEIPLMYHGTNVTNMDSICRRGLLVPNPAVNGVSVAHGSSMGVGIYTARDAAYSAGYASNSCSTIFACAVLTTGGRPYNYLGTSCTGDGEAVLSDSVVVLKNEARVCPLFLVDFEHVGYRSVTQLQTTEDVPHVALDLIRAMLQLHTHRLRWDARITARTLKQTHGHVHGHEAHV